MAHYFDTSALVKLLVAEPETVALRRWMKQEPRIAVSCDLARAELARAVRRAGSSQAAAARRLLDSIILVQVGAELFEEAGRLGPASLRTLDAIHLAAALELGDDLVGEAVVTYDKRMAEAAASLGIPTAAPT